MTASIRFFEWNSAARAANALTHSPDITYHRIVIVTSQDVIIGGDPVFAPLRFQRAHWGGKDTRWFAEVDGKKYSNKQCDLSKCDFYLEIVDARETW